MTSSEPAPARTKVAFLGPYSSYSHQATKSVFPDDEWELSPTVTIKEIFDVVQSGATQLGVVPFENSTHGPVLFTLDALADRQKIYKSLSVVGEIYLDVHHCLLGRLPPTNPTAPTPSKVQGKPLTTLSHIKRVYSHPQAFGQTQSFFASYLGKGVELLETSSTSKAAELAAADTTGSSAAVASEMAAGTMGLDVLASCIEDRDDNTTRFFVIAPADYDYDSNPLPERLRLQTSPLKCMVSFTVPHKAPGALSDVLGIFKKYDLNLTSINTTPSRVQPFQYLFFVEFEGKGNGEALLDDVGKVAESLRYWGHWMKQR